MISKNGATLVYDAHRRLKEITKSDGIKYSYTYDAGGLRVKKSSLQTGEITYSLFNGQYEIANSPGTATKHTVYIRGIKDDLLAQITREDASLLLANTSENSGQKTEIVYASLFPYITDCLESGVGCKAYLSNTIKFFATKYIQDGIYHPEVKKIRVLVAWGVVILLFLLLLERTKENSLPALYRYVTPMLTTAILFTFTSGCGIFVPGGSQGDAPWMALASGINANTPSVRNDGFTSSSGTSAPFAVPVSGMYFVHSDHLGSVSFLTNGRGSLVAGGEFGGKSDIQYKPYGEIDRTHSSGPDITKFKYTGQEEDKETGLMYYKSRYYDPAMGRFLQADDLVIPSRSMGMNRMMYVDGNPVANMDPTGNSKASNRNSKIFEYYVASQMVGDQNPEEVHGNVVKLYLFFTVFKYFGTGKKFDGPYFKGHNYTGSGNQDPFDGFFSWNKTTKQDNINYLALVSIFLEIPLEQALIFYFLIPFFRPPAKSYMDGVAQKHDDESPNSAGKFGSSKNSAAIVEADMRYIARFGDGLIKGKLNLEDFAVGMGGTILFSRLSMPTHALYAMGKGAMDGVARNRGRFVIRPGRFAKNGLTNMTSGSFYGN